MKKALTLFGALGGLLLFSGCRSEAPPSSQSPSAQVKAIRMAPQPVTLYEEFNGRVQAVEAVEIRARVSGHITEVSFEEGSLVKQGDLLFTIDPRPYEAAVQRAEAELAIAKSQAGLAGVQAERARSLFKSKALAHEEHDRRTSDLAQAQAREEAAQAALNEAMLNLEFTQIRSPIDGRIGQIEVKKGNLVDVNANNPVLTSVVSVDPVDITFRCDERTFLRMTETVETARQRGESREVKVSAGLLNEEMLPRTGMLQFVDHRFDEATGTIRLRARFANPDGGLIPGAFARVRLSSGGKPDALMVPESALLTDQNRTFVYVVGEGGVAERRDLQLGRLVNGRYMVEAGLHAGDEVVYEGVQKIFFPGMSLEVVPEMTAVAEEGLTH